jgi:zinc transporter ZupT
VLPWALAAAAGAMLFAIWHELAPMQRHGELRRRETLLVLGGFALMALLDNLFA